MGKARASTSSDAMRDEDGCDGYASDNVQLMLVKLRLEADMPYVALDMLKEV